MNRAVTFTLPEDMTLHGLEETSRGWIAYLAFNRKPGTLRGGIPGLTPQATIDAAEVKVRADFKAALDASPPTLDLDDLDLDEIDFSGVR